MNSKIFNTIIILFFITALSCKEDEIVQPTYDQPITELNGKIVGWNMGDTIMVSLAQTYLYRSDGTDSTIIYSTATIKSDGSFSLSLPTPPNELLFPYGQGGHSISDTSARYSYITSPWLYSKGKVIGYIYFSDKSEKEDPFRGNYLTYFMYCTKAVKIKGITYGSSRYYYDLDCLKGWNQIVSKVDTVLSPSSYVFKRYRDNKLKPNYFYTLTL